MSKATITTLAIYPVKSCAPVYLEEMELDDWGPVGDRRFMIVDPEGRFVTARKVPALLQVQAQYENKGSTTVSPRQWGTHLTLHADARAPLTIAIPDNTGQGVRPLQVRVWKDDVSAWEIVEGSQWFSDYLGQQVRLVYIPETSFRQVDPEFQPGKKRVGFADGFPLLIVNQASLDDFNQRLPDPIPISRFRANIVLSGEALAAWDEDYWSSLEIESLTMNVVKPCSRCILPTIDPATGKSNPAILKELSKFRRSEYGVIFGQNVVALGKGSIAVGTDVSDRKIKEAQS